ncbi:IRK-interacting protein isoform X2 [Malania oleifera]|uniref:IRK-interacting protein isoform X2 n=1 Tax=Malania oleifera TaxID=397392 RepID=UPI0025AE63AE|nr:IRK-interacting protein isoform X2 [Malania oleifera]
MAAATTATPIRQNHSTSNNNNNNEVNREEIQAAIAKAVELRAIHAAVLQGNSPSNIRFPSVASPISKFSAQDYPVFTPSYEDEPLPGYQQIQLENQTLPEGWDEYKLGGNGDDAILSDHKKENSSSRKGLPSSLVNLEHHICPAEDHKSVYGSSGNHQISVLQTSPGTDCYQSKRRYSLGDFRSSTSSCNKYSHSSIHSQPKSKGVILSWLFPRLKKKHKNGSSPNRAESEDGAQYFKDFGIMSFETLKKELMEANENRNAALTEVAEMKSSLGDLKQKLEYLEIYCEELKKALKQAAQVKDSQVAEKLGNFSKRVKSIDGNGESFMPVSEEVMVEGFLQVVSEARLSVKHFCKTLVAQIEETDNSLLENLNLLLQPYKLSLSSKYSKAALYHLEAIMNQSLYQDFENCIFQKNGSPKFLDPQQDRQAQFSSFVQLRNLSWNEVLRKGTKYYSEEFSKFCDQKMSCIVSTLNWNRPWPEQLLQAFFVAAKCIWLLHLLAFSFDPPLGILRVDENRSFDPNYMEDIFMDRQKPHGPSRVKVMVMPGFYVLNRALRCKVLCRYKSAA